ncbi:MAG TPA: carbamoyltransferase HypF [Terracidiphilus sp.]|nr:carbamoyltransferase HypF [Terracidiphilus sp.]
MTEPTQTSREPKSAESVSQRETSTEQGVRRGVRVQGVVQGVGFRPFVYRLADEEALAGFIGNDTDGVTIEIEGPVAKMEAFLERLRAEAPPLSRVDKIEVRELPATGENGFRIISSEVKGRVSTGIPADAATCSDCLRELLDPHDRRYRYPFLNCTNCGPRYTITRRIPYDRPQTSMAKFPMCPACQAEYDDPLNRRFHAQPNACPQCGPHVWLESGVPLDGSSSTGWESPGGTNIAADDPVQAAIERLLTGEIAGIKGIGGFHLSVDAMNESAVARLRERKHRYGKPLAVMVRDLECARELCFLTPEEESLLQTPARPIVLARASERNGIAPSVAPGIPWLGLFLPYAPLQHLLFADPRVKALVMTSANLSEEPIAIENDEASRRLGTIADFFLMHNRDILQRCDDSVSSVIEGAPQLIRRARGFVPMGVPLPLDAPPLLAVGGHLKNVFTLARGRFAFQSQHLGDLENLTGLEFFTESLAHLMQTFEIEPQAVVHDLHPGYLSTSWAKEWTAGRGLPLIAVQHHHAHIAACMAEHGLSGPVIGLSLDGTGYGTDGKIWGGEVLICRLDGFERVAHLDYAPMPGGEAAIREPWRMAFAHLRAAGFADEEARELAGATEQEARLMARMIDRGINAPLTSSLGRLFDAVAALILHRSRVHYEAQAAIELEGLAVDEDDHLHRQEYVPELCEGGDSLILKTGNLWRSVIEDAQRGVPRQRIAAEFHAGIAEGFTRAATRARETTGISQVALSGGCLHNRRLTRLLRSGLEEKGFNVLLHRNVSPGDGGLSYGQAVIGAAKLFHRDHANE